MRLMSFASESVSEVRTSTAVMVPPAMTVIDPLALLRAERVMVSASEIASVPLPVTLAFSSRISVSMASLAPMPSAAVSSTTAPTLRAMISALPSPPTVASVSPPSSTAPWDEITEIAAPDPLVVAIWDTVMSPRASRSSTPLPASMTTPSSIERNPPSSPATLSASASMVTEPAPSAVTSPSTAAKKIASSACSVTAPFETILSSTVRSRSGVDVSPAPTATVREPPPDTLIARPSSSSPESFTLMALAFATI